jgi:hypothetical protein
MTKLEHAKKLAECLRVPVEEESGNTPAYQRLLVKAQCTAEYCAGVTLSMLSEDARVDFIVAQLEYLRVRGYSREYVMQLVNENFRNHQFWC